VASINADLGAPMHLCARAHLEMAGMLVYLHTQIRKFLARETAGARFQEQLDRLFLARRVPWPAGQHDETNTQAINVLTMIDSVDDMFEEADVDELHGSYREAYEWLSERCHPNLSARAAHHETDRRDFSFGQCRHSIRPT
jgi:hypothetical protein